MMCSAQVEEVEGDSAVIRGTTEIHSLSWTRGSTSRKRLF